MSGDWASNRGADEHLRETQARIQDAAEAVEKARAEREAREQQPSQSDPRD